MQMTEGRVQQKARTRRDLLEAARRLMDSGDTFSVNAVADAAGISRATAYRYFPDADALMLEAALDSHVPSPEELVGDAQDVRERVHRVRHFLFQAVQDAENFYRRYLARVLDNSVQTDGSRQIRGGRRIPMYEHALAPVREELSQAALRDLVLSLSAVSGVESFIALKDACRADDETARRISIGLIDAILDKGLRDLEDVRLNPA
ncbi:TetR/AcrR family transcriptional regulator [Rubellimicrobium roseum]|uniref:TetR/AcrR family transcriptional regulator n=1 Tax=Rubellimicrobium roseum TaxID=687525 RepID=A0A5C4N944_9RHOB|nr:TetR/AcrR family transcriptional regulator [Rubellimicrobium roseum]TNC67214.1 TetR/AcrR family transcriptional regulator [Rubellimicrobium roseum]